MRQYGKSSPDLQIENAINIPNYKAERSKQLIFSVLRIKPFISLVGKYHKRKTNFITVNYVTQDDIIMNLISCYRPPVAIRQINMAKHFALEQLVALCRSIQIGATELKLIMFTEDLYR
jgi:hypothetical protein